MPSVALDTEAMQQERVRGSTVCKTYSLFILFGTGAWLTLNGSFSELPLLVDRLPEGWRMASVLAITVQLANLGPALYMGTRGLVLRYGHGRFEESLATITTFLVLGIGVASMVALSVLWATTTDIFGGKHSVAFITLVFLAALADCTSSVLFWRFAGDFSEVHISALATGEGMSGVVTSLLTWVQCATCVQPTFSVSAYFCSLAGILLMSISAFAALLQSRAHRRWSRQSSLVDLQALDAQPPQRTASATSRNSATEWLEHYESVKDSKVAWLLVLQGWVNFLVNGFTMSCLPLAAKPYGSGAYQWAQNLAMLIDPVAAAAGIGLPIPALGLIPIVLMFTMLHGYIFTLSLVAMPAPFLDSGGGEILVAASALARALSAYTKMRINVILKVYSGEDERRPSFCGRSAVAKRRLMWSGVSIQVGSFIGAAASYLLINHTSLFRSSS